MADDVKTAAFSVWGPAQKMRRALARQRSKHRTWPDGTVVVFNVVVPPHTYRYAAIYLTEPGKWYITGSGSLVSRSLMDEAFLELLGRGNVHDAEMAVGWEPVI